MCDRFSKTNMYEGKKRVRKRFLPPFEKQFFPRSTVDCFKSHIAPGNP